MPTANRITPMIDGILYLYPRSTSTVETRRCISELIVEIAAAVTVMNNIVDNHSGYPVAIHVGMILPMSPDQVTAFVLAINHAFELAVTPAKKKHAIIRKGTTSPYHEIS